MFVRLITSLIIFALLLTPASISANHAPNVNHGKLTSKNKKLNSVYKKQGEKIQNAFNRYQKKAAKIWGKEAVMPSAKRDVTYRNNFKERSIVNYDEGMVKIELALKPDIAKNPKHRQRN